MSAPQTAFYNDGGVGHGAFVATFSTAGSVVLESFVVSRPAKTIAQGNQIGAPLKQASVNDFVTATATAQVPVDSSGNNPTPITQGETFTAPANYGGESFYVETTSDAYRVGDYWKQDLNLRKKYN